MAMACEILINSFLSAVRLPTSPSALRPQRGVPASLTLLALVDELHAVLEELARHVDDALDAVCHCGAREGGGGEAGTGEGATGWQRGGERAESGSETVLRQGGRAASVASSLVASLGKGASCRRTSGQMGYAQQKCHVASAN